MDSPAKAVAYYRDNPVGFVTDLIGATPEPEQSAIMRDVASSPMVSVRSGHGIGKSAVASWLTIWFLCTRPFPKVPCTAPTLHQLQDILWAEISKWIRSNPVLARTLVWTTEKVYLRGHREEWFAVARTATQPDALQGFHADHVLFIVDEASGVDNDIFEPVLGALTTPDAKMLMLGNPTRLTGFFYESHHKNRASYKTHHFDGRKSRLVSQEFIARIVEMYGIDSDVFRVRVSGDFPKAMPDSFIPLDWCERQSGAERPEVTPLRIDIGVDVARYGDDSSAIVGVRNKTIQDEPEVHQHNDTMQIAGYTIVAIRRYAAIGTVEEAHVKIDCDGLGVGVFDRLREQREGIEREINEKREAAADGTDAEAVPFTLQVYECHFGGKGGKASDADPVEYENSTGVMWGAIREGLRTSTLFLWRDDRQTAELSARRYAVNSSGKIELEKKESMKKRGVSSPDIADALGLAMYDLQRDDWTLDFA